MGIEMLNKQRQKDGKLSEWQVKHLGDMATFRTGPFGSALHKSDYTIDGIPVINPMHINDGELTPSGGMTITEMAATLLSEFRLKCGEVIIGRRGEMGRCAVIQAEHHGWLCGTGSMIIRPSADLNATYLSLVLSDRKTIALIEEASVGSTMINLNQSVLSNLLIPLPPLPEQQAIAAALSDVDALIAAQEALVAKKQAIKQGAMQQLLTGRKRLPGFEGEWEEKRLGDLAHIRTGKANNDDKSPEGIYPFFVRSERVESINSYTFDGEAILIPGEGGIGSIFHYIDGRFDFHQRVYKISTFALNAFGKYIYFFLKQLFGPYAAQNSVKATVDSLRLPTFLNFKILLPALKEQQAIAAILSDMDAEIEALQAEVRKTQALKQGMMQELLTGRIRLVG